MFPDLVNELLTERPDMAAARVTYGITTATNTVPIDGGATSVVCPTVGADVPAGVRVAVLIQGDADPLIVGPVPAATWDNGPSFGANFENWGGGFRSAGVLRRDGLVYLRGKCRRINSTATADARILTLAAGYRPADTEDFNVACSLTAGWARVRINSSGHVDFRHLGTNLPANEWVELSGIVFAPDA